MQFDFTQTMKEASNEELIRIITFDRENYQEAAVIAAEAELKTRNLSPEKLNEAQQYTEAEHQQKESKANEPLHPFFKVAIFLCPWHLLIILLLSAILNDIGYKRQANELAKWAAFGLGFYVLLFILFASF